MFTVGLDEINGLILYSQLNPGSHFIMNFNKVSIGVLQNVTEETEIIFGSVLGDGKLEMPPRGKNARFGLIQSEDKKDYILSVLESLKGICSGKLRELRYYDKRTGKIYKSISF